MLFNSHVFVFLFLPLVLAGFFLLSRRSGRAAMAWLVIASLFFYGYWNPWFLFLLLGSISGNYLLGLRLTQAHRTGSGHARILLWSGITANLGLLGYFKYKAFFLENLALLSGHGFDAAEVFIPLAISFFTFQQIAYLADAYAGQAEDHDPLTYTLFVSFFPQLIAGPIVHHREMMPQFQKSSTYAFDAGNFTAGLTLFSIGLFKKVVIADGIGEFSDFVFAGAAAGDDLTALEAWIGALAFTFEIFYDFSAYSEMALGLARMFNITLPLNFNSPYKAANIIDFWRRWHITLSRFLRDYLYIPLGGNRRGKSRRHLNLMLTMLLGGLWHGAGWTFVIWGALHGFYLIINHAWSALSAGWLFKPSGHAWRIFAHTLTFLAVVVAWVFFRAPDMETALRVLRGMAGFNGFILPATYEFQLGPIASWVQYVGIGFGPVPNYPGVRALIWIALLVFVSVALPNPLHMLRDLISLDPHDQADLDSRGILARYLRWRFSTAWGLAMGLILAAALLALGESPQEFIYFEF
ncbi:MAG: MBOAT family O-acyltransferase [Gammaproteobacteria bacterium]